MLSREIERRLAEAMEIARSAKHEFITSEHVLLALTQGGASSEILKSLGVQIPRLRKTLLQYIEQHSTKLNTQDIQNLGGPTVWKPEFTLSCHRWIQRAILQVRNAGKDLITEGHFLIALFYEPDNFAAYSLEQEGLNQFDLIQSIAHGNPEEGLFLNSEDSPLPPHQDQEEQGLDRQDSQESALETYGINLNEKAKAGKIDPLVGRKTLVERMIQILHRRLKNNPLLIGEPGVGKTALVEGLADLIYKKEVPPFMEDRVLYTLDMGTLLAGTKFRGDFESRFKKILNEAKARPEVILFIDEIHTLIGAGSTGGSSMDAANLLKPLLSSGEVSCIGSTTFEEYRKYFEKDSALSRRFQKIDIPEPSKEESLEILKGLRPHFEVFHQVQYQDEALKAAVDLSVKYLNGKLLPDKAIDLIDEAGSRAKIKGIQEPISPEAIEDVVSHVTQIPLSRVSSSEKDLLRHLEGRLKAVIFGQDEAIEKLVGAIKYSKSGLNHDRKPIGSFLFTGPTGVGKTEVSRQVAEHLGIPFIRFDMSEYMEKHAVARLIGAPPGYLGFNEGGQLTEAIKRQPHSLVLLDEVEKAHPDILNTLLQVMDAGRLTDSQGRTTDFRHTLIIMTSNAGALDIAKGQIGIAPSHWEVDKTSQEALKRYFSPEFLNRIDAVVTFNRLGKDELLLVVQKYLTELKMTLQKQKIDLETTPEVASYLLEKGYKPEFGARPLGRTLTEYIQKPLIDDLLFGKLSKGGRVRIKVQGQGQKQGQKLHFEMIPSDKLTKPMK
jgi:ATP-dependent Clp protease ATP-binding subunit ClpA